MSARALLIGGCAIAAAFCAQAARATVMTYTDRAAFEAQLPQPRTYTFEASEGFVPGYFPGFTPGDWHGGDAWLEFNSGPGWGLDALGMAAYIVSESGNQVLATHPVLENPWEPGNLDVGLECIMRRTLCEVRRTARHARTGFPALRIKFIELNRLPDSERAMGIESEDVPPRSRPRFWCRSSRRCPTPKKMPLYARTPAADSCLCVKTDEPARTALVFLRGMKRARED